MNPKQLKIDSEKLNVLQFVIEKVYKVNKINTH